MENLIAALQILAKYTNDKYPTHCEHDVMYVPNVNWDEVTPGDMAELERLGFFKDTECFHRRGFLSYIFGCSPVD